MDKTCFLLFLLIQVWSQLVSCHRPVKLQYLPGFQGPLPFELETGYIGVDESDDVQLFYYFVKSHKDDPLILWLTGGPGCSAFSGLVYEIGPLKFKVVEYNGNLPTLVFNPHSWTQVSNIIFVDIPVGTGFSFARTPLASQSGYRIQVNQTEQFLRKWLIDHPEFLSNPIYIAGDSYSGMVVPAIVQKISNGNEEGTKPLINVQGYILGNPSTDPRFDYNSKIRFAHGKGLISDELFESLKRSCGEEYRGVDPGYVECYKQMQDYDKCTERINPTQIMEPFCAFGSTRTTPIFGRRSLYDMGFFDFSLSIPPVDCRDYAYVLSEYWANDKTVRKALHIQEGSTERWMRCNYGINYTYDIASGSTINYHKFLASKGYRSLIYSGDHDMVVPFVGTQAWIRSLNYSIVDDWRPWLVQGQVAGYTRTYSNQMTFATVKGGGHTAPEYKPEECFEMYKRWLSQEPL
ncbi:serine carboxypeptidase-like 17 [Mercurialis annua]|uniref:serine carboxypeptidase-like 17 n=1 Tax=Mercurialis annua TaxID=3986 RepID=UPI00215E385D|nr:serine carboxypeptidase-like 17 [Mercurialis annua]